MANGNSMTWLKLPCAVLIACWLIADPVCKLLVAPWHGLYLSDSSIWFSQQCYTPGLLITQTVGMVTVLYLCHVHVACRRIPHWCLDSYLTHQSHFSLKELINSNMQHASLHSTSRWAAACSPACTVTVWLTAFRCRPKAEWALICNHIPNYCYVWQNCSRRGLMAAGWGWHGTTGTQFKVAM